MIHNLRQYNTKKRIHNKLIPKEEQIKLNYYFGNKTEKDYYLRFTQDMNQVNALQAFTKDHNYKFLKIEILIDSVKCAIECMIKEIETDSELSKRLQNYIQEVIPPQNL